MAITSQAIITTLASMAKPINRKTEEIYEINIIQLMLHPFQTPKVNILKVETVLPLCRITNKENSKYTIIKVV